MHELILFRAHRTDDNPTGRRSKVLLSALVLGVLIVASVVILLVAQPRGGAVGADRDPATHVSAIDGAPDASLASVPAFVPSDLITRLFGKDGNARLVADRDGRLVYLGLSGQPDEACRLIVDTVDPTYVGSCFPLSTLKDSGGLSLTIVGAGPRSFVVGVVADDVVAVAVAGQPAEIRNNVFIASNVPEGSRIVIDHPSGTTERVVPANPYERPEQ